MLMVLSLKKESHCTSLPFTATFPRSHLQPASWKELSTPAVPNSSSPILSSALSNHPTSLPICSCRCHPKCSPLDGPKGHLSPFCLATSSTWHSCSPLLQAGSPSGFRAPTLPWLPCFLPRQSLSISFAGASSSPATSSCGRSWGSVLVHLHVPSRGALPVSGL